MNRNDLRPYGKEIELDLYLDDAVRDFSRYKETRYGSYLVSAMGFMESMAKNHPMQYFLGRNEFGLTVEEAQNIVARPEHPLSYSLYAKCLENLIKPKNKAYATPPNYYVPRKQKPMNHHDLANK